MLALSSVYRMLARHGWRKLAQDIQHPQSAPQARQDWKRNSQAKGCRPAPRCARGEARQPNPKFQAPQTCPSSTASVITPVSVTGLANA